MDFTNASKTLVTDLVLYDSSETGSNMVISCQLLSEIEFTGGVEACCKACCKLLQSYYMLVVYSDNTVNMHKPPTLLVLFL